MTLGVFSWWTKGEEKKAYQTLADGFQTEHEREHLSVSNPAAFLDQSDDMREKLQARLLARAPLSSFQSNLGADLLRWSVVDANGNEIPSESRIEPLADLGSDIFQVLPEEILSGLKVGLDSAPYAVPINVHRLNVIYYNTAALERFMAAHGGRSFLDFDVLCPAGVLDGTGTPERDLDLRIGMGVESKWPLSLLTFENLLPAISGHEFYSTLFRGGEYPDWEGEFRRTLRCLRHLSGYFRDVSEASDVDWVGAVTRVREGQYDFTVMGDWATPELGSALDDGAVIAQVFPRTEDLFVYTSDTFSLPASAPYEDHSREFLQFLARSDVQTQFSAVKGSFPARSDAEPPNERSREARDAFVKSTKLLATSGLFPPYFQDGKLQDLLVEIARGNQEIETVIEHISKSRTLFAEWQARLQEGPAPAGRPGAAR